MTRSLAKLAALALICFQEAAFATEAPHPTSCFPPVIEGFESAPIPDAQLASLKAYRNTYAAGYNAAPYKTAVSVFVYDRGPSGNDAQELKAAISEILSVHEGAELAMSGKGKVSVAGSPAAAQGGLFLWTEDKIDYGSFLWLVPGDKQYLKIRATYVRPPDDRELVEAMKFAVNAIETVGNNICRPE